MHFSKCEGQRKNNVCNFRLIFSLILWHFVLFWYIWSLICVSMSEGYYISLQKSLQTQKHSQYINLDRNVELLQRWQTCKANNCGRRLDRPIFSDLTKRLHGFSGSIHSEKLWHLRRFCGLWSSYHCPLHHCPSWICLASLLPLLRQWLLPRSVGFSRFHTSYCLMWSPAPLEGGSHGTFSVTKIKKPKNKPVDRLKYICGKSPNNFLFHFPGSASLHTCPSSALLAPLKP